MCSSQTAAVRVDVFRMLAACNKCINHRGNLLVGLHLELAMLWSSRPCSMWSGSILLAVS